MMRIYYKYFFALQFSLVFLFGQVSAQSGLQRLDDQVLIDLAESRTPAKTGFFMFLSKHNDVVNVGVPLGLLAGGIIADDKKMRQNALYVASSSAVNALVTMLIKKVVKRPRPFLANVKIQAVYQPTHYSFPSGHTSTSFTTATALSQAYPKWYVVVPSYLWAGSVSFSRLYLGVHYPTDVAAGALLGTGTAFSLRSMRPD
ncbi:membrane-associated phospholipid phosphatase [Pedobacter africanus]|uniref:Undecaprenyl-diphosphatase n=1 Tax=Pedobacter africanus TaxID=151894 RepID=A0ACC6KS72_9SPHI|nr:phosphatase PAP2 family protein [Pedobacter africanus]MDR6782051.1 undecaprenyl-diphosphatase [Pedobacter africanus]